MILTMGGEGVVVCDAAVMSRPEIRRTLVAQAASFDMATLRASVQDMALGTRAWGFDLGEIRVPCALAHSVDRPLNPARATFHCRNAAGGLMEALPGVIWPIACPLIRTSPNSTASCCATFIL